MADRNKKNLEIEALRGVAILMVLYTHLDILFFWGSPTVTRLWNAIPGWGGVDLFFCISGYVITRSLLPLFDSKPSSFIAVSLPFWIRRAWRLLPSAWLWLAVTVAFSAFANRSGAFVNFRANLGDAISILFQVSNFHFMTCYRDHVEVCGGNGAYWSLSLEEQFYIVFPFLMFFVPARWRAWLLGGAVVGQIFLYRPIFSLAWTIRTDAICLGALLAMAQSRASYASLDPAWLRSKPIAIAASVISTFILAAIPTHSIFIVPFTTGLLAIVSAAMVFAASFDKGYIFPLRIAQPILQWFGSRSYALYLIHYPVFHMTSEFWFRTLPPGHMLDGTYSLRATLTAFPLLFLLAELNFRFVETPGRRFGQMLAKRISERAASPRTADAPFIALAKDQAGVGSDR
ncbi:acyltransferase family protein [Burkholderia vietnamiensis]|uniref:acyltransferase family protein n=1 Tax=Burkholderia vietnamiensis TaxID=60552 RepID=UPI001B92DBB4|nr:acyltransferase [Burkholderia vietnamiensis]MBR8188625.1 acyltransferase [Burkholderia vietnamiensis]MCA8264787.1 acyltransferase [Burkholderia vietnamiensis]